MLQIEKEMSLVQLGSTRTIKYGRNGGKSSILIITARKHCLRDNYIESSMRQTNAYKLVSEQYWYLLRYFQYYFNKIHET